jgi:4-amino-4-deoxy-L-arabinose transferase-like glycosyltransferase
MTWSELFGPAQAPAPVAEAAPHARPIAAATRGHLALLGVVGLAALLYGWNLTVSGYANVYYSAAAQAASQSWSAWFFGSLDAANFITVDKPPAALWLMGLSVRILGVNSFAILLPEALAGVGTVAVLFLTVRRTFGVAAATIAGLVMALTPAAVLMFRYNNPDAVLTLLLVTAAWAVMRGLDSGRLRWPLIAATLVGFAFLTKYLQAYLVLPAFALVWLVAAPGSLRRRLVGLVAAAIMVVISSGWWVAIVELIPAANRPFIGGSETNSVLDLILGYDGLGRIFGMAGPGGGGGGPGGGGPGGGFGGEPGLWRLFNDQFGGQIGWLLPVAFLALAAGLVARARAPRTDSMRAGYLMWGGWLAVHVLVFSLMSGIIHSYYVVAMAPSIAALVGAGAVELWRRLPHDPLAGVLLAVGLAAAGVTSWLLLERTPDFFGWLHPVVLAAGFAAAGIVAVLALIPGRRLDSRARFAISAAAVALAVVASLAGPAAYAAETIGTAYGGGDPAAGPTVASRFGGGPFAGGPSGGAGIGQADGNGAFTGGAAGFAGPGGSTADPDLVAYLVANRGDATWIAAAGSSDQAGVLQLASGEPVMAMGGFMGSDPAPSLLQLKGLVASGQLRYVIVDGRGGGFSRGGSVSGERDAWVTQSCAPVDVSGTTVYDCAGAT